MLQTAVLPDGCITSTQQAIYLIHCFAYVRMYIVRKNLKEHKLLPSSTPCITHTFNLL